MGLWWDTATHSAAVEYGRRHYRSIAALRVLAKIWPGLIGVGAVAGLVYAVVHWGPGLLSKGGDLALNLVPMLLVAIGLAAFIAAALWAWHRWGFLLEIFISGRHIAYGILALLVLGGIGAVVVWP